MAALTFDRSRTALLLMDFQEGIVSGHPEPVRSTAVSRAAAALEAARAAGMLVVYVSVRLRSDFSDVSPRNKRSSAAKAAGRLAEDSAGVQIVPALAPRTGEPLVIKRRVGPFIYTDLETVLRSHDIATLVLTGFATSGVILTAVRTAADMDYDLIVLQDAIGDPSPEVHKFLVESIFPSQATIANAEDFISAVK